MPEIVRWFAENPVRWVIPAVFLVAVVGVPLTLWWEKRHPSSFTRQPAVSDDAVLDAAEEREQGRLRSQAEWRRWEPDSRAGASEAAEMTAARMAEAAKRNALFHP